MHGRQVVEFRVFRNEINLKDILKGSMLLLSW